MKKGLLLVWVLLLSSLAAMAQVPQAMNYQGIARDESGKLIQNKIISLRISVLEGGAQGAGVYAETHKVITSDFGSFSLAIGRGQVVKGEFAKIDWGTSNHYLRIEMDANGGATYTLMGASELLSVPYAYHAGSANRIVGKGNGGLGIESTSGVPANAWSLFGNSGTSPGIDYLGTSDLKDLILKTNARERFVIRANGELEGRAKLSIEGEITSVISSTKGAFYLADPGFGLKREGDNNVRLFSTDGNLLLMGNNTGIGTDNPTSKLSVFGNLAVGENYATGTAAPENGAIIEGNVGIGVNNPTDKLEVAGNTSITGNTAIGGTATIEGVTTLNSTTEAININSGGLVVKGGAGIAKDIHIGEDLNVLGNADLQGDLKVAGSSEFVDIVAKNNGRVVNDLGVGNNLNVGDTASVDGVRLNVMSPAEVPTAFNVQVGDGTTNKFTIANTGRVSVKSNVSGQDNSSASYPVFVEAPRNGMAIKVDASGEGLNSDENFIGFFDNNGIRGAIEGQNSIDVLEDPEFIAELLYQGFKVAALGVAIAATPFEVADIVWLTADLAYYATVQSVRGAYKGVSYSSGSGDYAEWLPRANSEETILAGDIVGVFGGKVTKSTKGAQQLLAVSTSPVVLGNMPQPGEEHLSEKIAFMGQIPVKVRGAVQEGDYIIPSGMNDGVGLAVAPTMMTADEYAKVIGRAWASSDDKGEKLVNVVVGLNAGDVAKLLQKDAKEREEIKAALSLSWAEIGQNSIEIGQLRTEVNELRALEAKLSALEKAVADKPASKAPLRKLARAKAKGEDKRVVLK